MPGQRLPMRKIRDVLRLRAGGMSKRNIAASLAIGATAAGDCVRRARRAGLSWPLPENLSDEALERLLYPPPLVAAKDRRAQPDWAEIHRELRRPGVTLQLLWEEHRGTHPDGYRGRRCQPCLSARGIGRRAQSDPVSCRGRRKGCTERIRLHGCGGRSPSSRHADDAGEQPGFGRRRNAAAVPDAHPGRVSLIGWAGTVTPPFGVNSGRWQQGAETAASSH
jgi:hypothetical protein